MKELVEKIRDQRLKEHIEHIVADIEEKNKVIKSLQTAVNNFSLDDAIIEKDREIKSLRNELANGFSITGEEWEAIHQWQDKHIKEVHNGDSYSGAIGGRWTYEFTPTSIGDIGTVKCSCGAEYTFRELE